MGTIFLQITFKLTCMTYFEGDIHIYCPRKFPGTDVRYSTMLRLGLGLVGLVVGVVVGLDFRRHSICQVIFIIVMY